MNSEIQLPPLLARFVESMNRQDSATFLICFADGAVVEDEGQTHRGLDEIQSWIETAFAETRPVLDVTAYEPAEAGDVMTGKVSGDFPGSPVQLHYHLTHDSLRITALRCAV